MAAWGPDNTLVFGVSPAGMARISAAGGPLQNVPILDPQKNERWVGGPQWLPDGKAVLFSMRAADVDSFNDSCLAVYSFQTGQRKILIDGQGGKYLAPGYVVSLRGGTFFAAPFDLSRLAATGPPVPVLDDIYQNAASGTSKFAISPNGSLAYVPGGEVAGARKMVWVDRQGEEQPLPLPPRSYLHPRISPDGLQLAIEVEGPNHDVFTYDLTRGTLTKLTFDGSSHAPLWTPDGRRLTFRVGMPDPFTMWTMPADRSAPKERLTTIGSQQSAASWSPDGRVVAFTQVDAETKGDIYVVAMDAERKPRAFARTGFNEGSPRFSPDGQWIAYCSNESGRNEVYVQEYPGPGPKLQISTEGGTDPVWKARGGELYYRNGEKMMMVAVGTKPTFSAGSPGMLWEGHYNEGRNSVCGAPGAGSSNYDVASDGRRFLMVKESAQDAPPQEIRVVLNWSAEVKQILESKKN
jgi:Tol biopolymer transport system component